MGGNRDDHDLWIFGYGSLMWHTGFEHTEAVPALLVGFSRAFCVYSVVYRGTPERPGLVLGLDRGGTCAGVAFRVPAAQARDAIRYLRAREQVSGVYRETLASVTLKASPVRHVRALTFVVERNHPGYAGNLPITRQVRLIRAGIGRSGANVDYAAYTIFHLQAMGFCERRLARLLSGLGPVITRRGLQHSSHSATSGLALARSLRATVPGVDYPRRVTRRRYVHRNALVARFDDTWPA